MLRVYPVLQNSQYDCGYACLAMLFGFKDKKVSIEQLLLPKTTIGRDGLSFLRLKQVANEHSATLHVFEGQGWSQFFEQNKIPIIMFWKQNHFIIVKGLSKHMVHYIDPATGDQALPLSKFNQSYSGYWGFLEKKRVNKETFQKQHSAILNLLKWLSTLKPLLAAIIVLSVLFQSINLVFPFITQYIIDHFKQLEKIKFSMTYGVIILLTLGILYFGVHVLRVMILTRIQSRLSSNMTNSFIAKIFSLPLSFFSGHSSGDIINRVDNIVTIREILSGLATTVILDISLILIYLVTMFLYSPDLSILVLIFVLIQVLSLVKIVPIITKYTNQEVNSQSKFQTNFIEALRSITYIKTLGDSRYISNRLKNNFNEQLSNYSKRMNWSSILGGFSGAIEIVLPIFIFLIGIRFHQIIGLSLGALVAFTTIATRFLTPVTSIIDSYQSIKLVEQLYIRVDSVLNEDDDPLEQQNTNDTYVPSGYSDINLQDISFGYGNTVVLNHVNLIIKPHQKILLIGKTGVGKTTLLNLLSSLYTPTNGKIYFGNKEYRYLNIMSFRKKIGYINQDITLFNGTIFENIRFFNPDVSDAEVIHAAKIACIHADIMQLPMGYHTILNDNGGSLSGGQRQRLSIARTIAANPDILFVDEGTSNLDRTTESQVINNLFNSNKTIVFVSHRHTTLPNVDCIYELKDKKLLAKN